MKALIGFLFVHWRYCLVGFLGLTLTVGVILRGIDDDLVTRHTPNGMLSLHLARTSDDAIDVRRVWQGTEDHRDINRIPIAVKSLKLDFLFVIAYGGLFFSIFIWEIISNKGSKWHKHLLWLPFGLMLVDTIENVLCIQFLNGGKWSQIFRVTSLLKYWLVIGNLFFMKSMWRSISDYAKVIIELFLRFRIVVIALLVIYLALWKADQGQDLLISLNATWQGLVVFMVVISISAFLFWHIPKFLSPRTSLFVQGNWIPQKTWQWLKVLFSGKVVFQTKTSVSGKVVYVADSDLARMFGALTFLIPAFGILNVLEIYGVGKYHPNAWLLVSTVSVLLLLKENYIDNAFNNLKYRWLFYLYFVGTIVALGIFAYRNTNDPPGLRYLFWALLLLAGAFLILVSIRRSLPKTIKNIPIGPWIMWSSVFLTVAFIYYNFDPYRLANNIDVNYATLGIFFCGVVSYCLFFLWLVLWGRATEIGGMSGRSRVNVAGIFIFISIATAVVFDNRFHDVHLINRKLNEKWVQPPTLEAYIHNWLHDNKRASLIAASDTKHPYPIFVVNTYGGGIRAAAWTSLVIAHLDDIVRKSLGESGDFQDHVFAYSGASGGTIGAAVMCALKKNGQRPSLDELVDFYKKDFLSPVVVGLIGRDYIASTIGVNWSDRAQLQDSIWECQMNKWLSNPLFSEPITSIWDSCNVPLLFANTTNVEKGVKGIVAPVTIDVHDFPTAIPVMQLIYEDENKRHADEPHHRIQTLKLSTAAFMSARFPFISPAGRIDASHHFLDGGIYENSGGETAVELIRVIERSVDAATRAKIRIVVVSLSSSPPDDPTMGNQNLFEIAAPLEALVSNVDGNAHHADGHNRMVFRNEYFKLRPAKIDSLGADSLEAISITKESIKEKSEAARETYSINAAILPLGWQLSQQALDRLKKNATGKSNERNVDSLVRMINNNRKR